jgi:putative peptidoglycan lipid II flippase
VSAPPHEDEWSAPSLHTSASYLTSFQPPVDHGSPFDPVWSPPVYVGRKGKRVRGPAAQPGGATDTADEVVEQEPVAAVDDSRSLLRNSRTVAIGTIASRLTGFLRSSLLVAALGVGAHSVGDLYNAANNFPNMVYELLLGGVLSSVFVPLLVGAQERDEDDGVGYAQRLLSIGTAALAVVTVLAVACAPLLAAGFVPAGDERSLTSIFATLLLPEIFFYGLGAMLMALLNVRNSYGPGAWSSVLNNVVMIVTLVIFWLLPGPSTLTASTMTTAQVLVVGIGTTLGIAAQALVLFPALRNTGFRWRWRFRGTPNEAGRLREVGTLSLWVLGYVVVSQIGVSAVLKVGAHHHVFAVFTNADLMLQMPYGILVVSLLTALMPRLSRAAAQGRTPDVVDDFGLGARLSALTLIPVTALLIVLAQVLNIVLFAYGDATITDARLMGTALAASAFGLFPFALIMLQLRVFYAMKDGRTPTFINIGMVTTKVALIAICVSVFHSRDAAAVSLTVSTSASYVIGALLGHLALTRRLGSLRFRAVLPTFGKSLLASAVGAAVAFVAVRLSEHLAGYGHSGALLAFVLGAGTGLVALVLVAWRLRIPELQQLRGMVAR